MDFVMDTASVAKTRAASKAIYSKDEKPGTKERRCDGALRTKPKKLQLKGEGDIPFLFKGCATLHILFSLVPIQIPLA